MARLGADAERQVADLALHYIGLKRERAVELLVASVRQSLASFDSDGVRLRPYPGGYKRIAAFGLSWLKVHRYWFGALRVRDEWVITTVVYETADIPAHVNTDTR
jgi:hypothetical protein